MSVISMASSPPCVVSAPGTIAGMPDSCRIARQIPDKNDKLSMTDRVCSLLPTTVDPVKIMQTTGDRCKAS